MQRVDWRRERNDFLQAVAFLTRVPIPAWVPYEAHTHQRLLVYLPLVGLCIGGLAALVFALASFLWPTLLAVLLSTGFVLALTGALHEDGFADCCDGIGAGNSVERRLQIMKDSRLGSYGVAGLLGILSLKVACLSYLDSAQVVLALLLGHSLSRALAVALMSRLDYVQMPSQSKVETLARPIAKETLLTVGGLSLAILALLVPFTEALILLVVLGACLYLGEVFFRRRLGGYTGDALGALQQCAELSLYLTLVALWSSS